MKKRFLAVLLAVLTAFSATALAAPVLTGGTYTAYIGENNYLYLEDEYGATKVLHATIVDLVGMDDTRMYCLTAEGKLYAIMLDGSASSIVSAAPTADELASYRPQPRYTLVEGALSITDAAGSAVMVAQNVVAACSNSTNLYYIEQGTAESALRTVSLTVTGGAVTPVEVGAGVAAPLSMIATDDALTLVAADHSIILIDLSDNSYHYFAAISQDTAAAVCQGSKLLYFTMDENGRYTLESSTDSGLTVLGGTAARAAVTVTPTPVPASAATPTIVPNATATPKPTATAKPAATSTPDDGRIRLGATGSKVRKMQQRLFDLGYPVGNVDGSFGNNTLLAVNLFQDAIGYRERSYASTSMLDKLNSKSAPAYDPYAPLKLEDSGTNVLLMQTQLHDLGYDPGKLDGIYGKGTAAAIELFQFVAQLTVTGEADRVTLEKLFDLNAPINPGTQPTAKPTTTPVVVTDAPIVPIVTPPPANPSTTTDLGD